MKQVKYIIGRKKQFFDFYIKIYVFLHFFKELMKGNFPAKSFYRFLKRLLFFLSKMKENKYVNYGKLTKISLYVPAFPSPAFFKACKKVMNTDEKMPCVTVLISVTSGCRYNCEHCYQKLDYGKDMDIDLLCDTVRTLDKMGVSFFNIEGGEPFLVYERLRKVCNSVSNGEIWINSTGDGMTLERLIELKQLGVMGMMFSIHSAVPETVNSFMQSDKAWQNLTEGIQLCHQAGLRVASNTCVSREDYFNGNFRAIMEFCKSQGVSIIQLIKPKPSGGWLGSEMDYFSQEDMKQIEDMVFEYNNTREYLEMPFIAAQIVDEKSNMFGCTAGGTDRFYINAKGDVQPCEFLNISYGNIMEEKFESIYQRMRESFNVPGDKWLCETCSSQIASIVKDNNIKSFPLSKELSQLVTESWDRGNSADFYDKVNKI